MRVRPTAERKIGHAPPDFVAQLPGMLDASRRPEALVSAQHHQRFESVMMRAIRVGEAVVERMLARQKGHHARTRHITAQVDDEMAEVVFFLRSHRAVGQEHERAAAGQAANRVIRVDPRVPARRRFELRPWRAQLRGDNAPTGSQVVDEGIMSGTVTRR